MKNWIVRRLIDICCKQALKYDQRRELLSKQQGLKYIYAIGSNVVQRDTWLKRIEWLQNSINK